MSLSDEEKLKFEDDFRYLVDKYIQYLIMYNQMVLKTNRSFDEEQELQTIQQLLLSIGEVLSITMSSVGDDMFGKSIDMYYKYKDTAAAGNIDASELIQELKPLFEASLNSRMTKN